MYEGPITVLRVQISMDLIIFMNEFETTGNVQSNNAQQKWSLAIRNSGIPGHEPERSFAAVNIVFEITIAEFHIDEIEFRIWVEFVMTEYLDDVGVRRSTELVHRFDFVGDICFGERDKWTDQLSRNALERQQRKYSSVSPGDALDRISVSSLAHRA
jgi:hypothetical protein